MPCLITSAVNAQPLHINLFPLLNALTGFFFKLSDLNILTKLSNNDSIIITKPNYEPKSNSRTKFHDPIMECLYCGCFLLSEVVFC